MGMGLLVWSHPRSGRKVLSVGFGLETKRSFRASNLFHGRADSVSGHFFCFGVAKSQFRTGKFNARSDKSGTGMLSITIFCVAVVFLWILGFFEGRNIKYYAFLRSFSMWGIHFSVVDGCGELRKSNFQNIGITSNIQLKCFGRGAGGCEDLRRPNFGLCKLSSDRKKGPPMGFGGCGWLR